MRISAKADYAVRAAAELAAAQAGGQPVRGKRSRRRRTSPERFLENILSDLRHAGIATSQRGAEGGH